MPRSRRLIAWVLVFLLWGPAAVLQARCFYHFPEDCNSTSITDRDICDFHKVDSDLYRGSQPKCSGYAKLAELGIRTVVNLQGAADRELRDCERNAPHGGFGFHIVSLDISYPEIGLTGVPDQKMRRLFALMQHAPKPLFVNCKLGKDRTGVVVALYRMKRHEMTFAQAEREAHYYRLTPRLIGLTRTLDRYRYPRELAALPAPVISSEGPRGVCRPKGLEAFGSERRD